MAVLIAGCARAETPQTGDDDSPPGIDAGEGDFDAAVDGPSGPLPDATPGTPDAAHGAIDASTIPMPDAAPVTDPNLVDDLNDGNDSIRNVPGRVGTWFTFHDETVGGVQTPGDNFAPSMPGADGTGFAAKTTGHGFADWGAGIGFDLNTPGSATMKGKFNGTGFTGVSFKAKGNVAIRFSVQITAVLETTLGGTCTPSMVAGQECDDVHGKSITLTSSWADYQVPFSQLAQEGWGKPATFDKTAMTAVQFQTVPGATFDFSIDDIRFY